MAAFITDAPARRLKVATSALITAVLAVDVASRAASRFSHPDRRSPEEHAQNLLQSLLTALAFLTSLTGPLPPSPVKWSANPTPPVIPSPPAPCHRPSTPCSRVFATSW